MAYDNLPFSSHAGTSLGGADSSDKLLLHLIDGGLAGCIFVVPFLLGGRMAVGEFLLVLLAVTVALAWTVRQSLRRHRGWRWSGVELLLLAGVVLLIVQIVPMPLSLLQWLSPSTSSLLPLWSEEQAATFQLSPWNQVSLTPAATQAGLILFLAYSLLFLVTVQRIRSVEDVERLLHWVGIAAVLMAAFGLLQFFTNNGKFFWFYEHPFSNTSAYVNGGFTNRNHFAHFLALGIGPLIWWIQHAWRRRHRHAGHQFAHQARDVASFDVTAGFRILALAIVLLAVLLSLSRGGALVTFVAAAIAVAVCYQARSLNLRFMLGLAAIALVTGVCLTIYGQDQVTSRLDDFTEGSLAALDGRDARRTIWTATMKAIPHFWLMGSGAGSFQSVYPMFLPWLNNGKYYTHAENGYLQVTLETGIPGLVLLVAGIAFCSFWCLKSLWSSNSKRHLVCTGAVSASLAVSVLHSCVDFVWYVPGCMAVVAILAACACRLRQLAIEASQSSSARNQMPRFAAVAFSVLLLGLGGWMLSDRFGLIRAEPEWTRYLIMQRRPLDSLPAFQDPEHPPTPEEESDTLLAIEQKKVHELELVTEWAPNHAKAHMALAAAYLRLFELLQARSPINAMPLSEVCDAAVRSQFPSRDALNDWLLRAVGQHAQLLDMARWHARKGLMLSPLDGEGYLYLGELGFLRGVPVEAKSAYLAQARKVRPFDGTVLFYAGKEAARIGDLAQTLEFWRQSYNCGRPYQRQLIESLAGRTHPEHLEAEIQLLLQTFQPDFQGLQVMWRVYRPIARPEQLLPLHYAYATAAAIEAKKATKLESASLWFAAMQSWAALGDIPGQLECGRAVLRADPNHFAARQALGFCLADQHQYTEAEEHLRWCLQRKPHYRGIEAKLREVLQNRTCLGDQTAIRPLMGAPQR